LNLRLLWEQEASMFEIEKYLGFHDEIPTEKCWLKDNPYFVPSRNHDTIYRIGNSKKIGSNNCDEWNNLEEWIDFGWQRHKFGTIINWVFYIEAFAAVVLIYGLIKI